MGETVVYVMAGGQGERLRPLTDVRAKPAVPFGGIFRIIDFTLSNCVNSGLRRIYVLTQYKSYSLVEPPEDRLEHAQPRGWTSSSTRFRRSSSSAQLVPGHRGRHPPEHRYVREGMTRRVSGPVRGPRLQDGLPSPHRFPRGKEGQR